MSDTSDKDQATRIEKFAQAHLDRANTISGGATKTALAWFVALAIIWSQHIEHKLAQVRTAQMSGHKVVSANTGGAPELRLLKLEQQAQMDNDLAKQEEIDLPFSIKIKVPPRWLPTLWLVLAFGLTWYLLDTRRRILRLAGRGLRLLTTEINAEPKYVRSLVGGSVWWLLPLPAKPGQAIRAEEFHRALGWGDRDLRGAFVAILLCLLLLIAAETRVVYVGFCVASYFVDVRQPSPWLLATTINGALFAASVLCVWRWFSSQRVPDELALESVEPVTSLHRRRVLAFLLEGSALTCAAFAWLGASTYSFANARGPRKIQSHNYVQAKRRRRKRSKAILPTRDVGLWMNMRTKTVHIASPACKRCLIRTDSSDLVRISSLDVQWNARGSANRLAHRPGLASQSFTKRAERLTLEQEPRQSERTAPFTTVQRKSMPKLPAGMDNEQARSGEARIDNLTRDNSGRSGGAAPPHPHTTHRTFMIEHAALDLVRNNKASEACEFLLNAVQATPTFGLRTGMRLYDLLAGLALRFNRPQVRVVLLRVMKEESTRLLALQRRLVQPYGGDIVGQPYVGGVVGVLYRLAGNELFGADPQRQESRPKRKHHRTQKGSDKPGLRANVDHNQFLVLEIQKRVKKWTDPNTNWYKRWSNAAKPVKWGGGLIS